MFAYITRELRLKKELRRRLGTWAKEIAEFETRRAKKRAEKEARRATVLSEWERTHSLPQSEEVGSVSVWCSLVCLT